MKFSFVIPSFDRKDDLQRCIQSIEAAYEFAQNTEIEVQVVFNEINLDKLLFCLKFPELISMQHLEKNIVSRAKNTGIKNASGEYIVLIDDDATLREDFLLKLSHVINDKVKAYCARLQDFQTKECFTKKENVLGRKYLGRMDYNFFRGSGLIIHKDVLERAGMFSEEFGPGGTYPSCEESDLFFRIKMLKEQILFVPELVIYHPTSVVLSELKAFRYSCATGALLTKYCFVDCSHLFAYLFLISRTFFICIVRLLQTIFFPRAMNAKNQEHRYASVIRGMSAGIFQYLTRSFSLLFVGRGR